MISRLDFSKMFNINNRDLLDVQNHYKAIDAVYNILKYSTAIHYVEWENDTNYDLSFKLHTTSKFMPIPLTHFIHLNQPMSILCDKCDDNVTNIHIKYNSSR